MSGLNEIVSEALRSAGADDWRVQAGAAALLIAAGVAASKRKAIRDWWRARRRKGTRDEG